MRLSWDAGKMLLTNGDVLGIIILTLAINITKILVET